MLANAGWVDLSGNIPWPNDSIDLHDVQFFGDEGWVLALCYGYPNDSGRVLHTTDGGQTFETKRLPYLANAMHWIDRQEAYIACQNGRVMRTTNGGDTWLLIGSAGSAAYDITFPPTGDTGMVCGFQGMAKRVTASGLISTPTGVNSHLYSVSFPVSAADGWTCGGTIILHYYEGEWHTDQAYPSEGYDAIFFANDSRGWCVGDDGIIIRTSGDGHNWNQMWKCDTTLNSVFFRDTLRGWTVGGWGVILSTTDGGLSWRREPTSSLTNDMLIRVFAPDTGTVYVVGNRKTFLKYTSAGGIEERNRLTAYGSRLTAPTIVHGVLSLEGDCPRTGTVPKTALLDATGRKVTDLHPGPNDVRALAPGVYFVRELTVAGREPSAINVRKVVKTD